MFSAAILDAILNISANFLMGKHVVISYVSITFVDHKNVCLALGISIFSAIQSEIFNFVFGSHLGHHLEYLC